jgi:FtsZ-binding cell division protein ZapB
MTARRMVQRAELKVRLEAGHDDITRAAVQREQMADEADAIKARHAYHAKEMKAVLGETREAMQRLRNEKVCRQPR